MLAADGGDAPSLVYLVDGEGAEASLAAAAGLPDGHALAAARVPVAAVGGWPIAEALDGRQVLRVDDLASRLGHALPGCVRGPTGTPGLVAPLLTGRAMAPAGVLILGASPRRAVDEEYRQFAAQPRRSCQRRLQPPPPAEAERSRAEALATIDRAKTVFFSNVSHEFRTPLTLMLGPTEDALRVTRWRARRRGPADGAPQSLRLLKLVNALLDFSRLEAGRMRVVLAGRSRGIHLDLASAFRSAFDRAGLRSTTVRYAPSATTCTSMPTCEENRLQPPVECVEVHLRWGVTLSLDDAGDRVRLTVSDTGVGIETRTCHCSSNVSARGRRSGCGPRGLRHRPRTRSGTGAPARRRVRRHQRRRSAHHVTVTVHKGRAHLPPDAVRDGAATARTAELLRHRGVGGFPMRRPEPRPPPSRTRRRRRRRSGDDHPGRAGRGRPPTLRQYLERLLTRHWSVETAPRQRARDRGRAPRPTRPRPHRSDDAWHRRVRTAARAARIRTQTIPIVLLWPARRGGTHRRRGVWRRRLCRQALLQPGTCGTHQRADGARARQRDGRTCSPANRSPARKAELQSGTCTRSSWKRRWRCGPARTVLRGGTRQRPDLRDLAPPARPGHGPGRCSMRCRCAANRGSAARHGVRDRPAVCRQRSSAQFRTGADGELAVVPADFVYTPLRTPAGTVDGVMVMAADVTDPGAGARR